MVRGKVELCQEIGTEDALADVGNDEVEFECPIADHEGFANFSVALDVCSVCGAELRTIGAKTSLGFCWGDDGEESPSVDEPSVSLNFILYVKKMSVWAGRGIHACRPAFPFDGMLLNLSQPRSHVRAPSRNERSLAAG